MTESRADQTRWVAALHDVVKTEWDSYFRETDNPDDGILLEATDKGKPYADKLLEQMLWTSTPLPYGDMDLVAVHWLMTLLLRRNVAVGSTLTFKERAQRAD